MAPEALKDRRYSTKSDVWSFGVVMYELFARSDPYPLISPVNVAMGVVYENLRLPVPPPSPSADNCAEPHPIFIEIMEGNNHLLMIINQNFNYSS
jgi:c-src tyrosine kinase